MTVVWRVGATMVASTVRLSCVRSTVTIQETFLASAAPSVMMVSCETAHLMMLSMFHLDCKRLSFYYYAKNAASCKKRQHKQYNHKTRKIKADWHADTVCSQIVRPFFSYDTYQRNILKTDERFWRQLAHVVHGQGRETFNFRNSGGERSRSHAAWFSTPWVECFSSWLTNFCCNYFRQRRR